MSVIFFLLIKCHKSAPVFSANTSYSDADCLSASLGVKWPLSHVLRFKELRFSRFICNDHEALHVLIVFRKHAYRKHGLCLYKDHACFVNVPPEGAIKLFLVSKAFFQYLEETFNLFWQDKKLLSIY